MEKLYAVTLYGPDGDLNPIVPEGKCETTNADLAISEFEKVGKKLIEKYFEETEFCHRPENKKFLEKMREEKAFATEMLDKMVTRSKRNGIVNREFGYYMQWCYSVTIEKVKLDENINIDCLNNRWR